MRAPSNSPITLRFGDTDPPYSASFPHKGVDFAYVPDNVIYAPFAGKVTQVPNNGNDGNGTYMTDPQGRFHGMLHASSYLVPNGSQVSEGQPIAVMGDTGFAQGVHLHWAVKEGNQFIDPLTLIEGGHGGGIVGVTIVGAPAAAGSANGRIDVFARGSDDGLWQTYFDTKGWHEWIRVGGGIASSPAVPSPYQSDRIDVFATGVAGDLMHFWFDKDGWHGPESLGVPQN